MAERISADDLKERIGQKLPVLFLDVREANEIAETGTVAGAVKIPMKELEARLAEVPKAAYVVTA